MVVGGGGMVDGAQLRASWKRTMVGRDITDYGGEWNWKL